MKNIIIIALALLSGAAVAGDFTPWADMTHFKVRIDAKSMDILEIYSHREDSTITMFYVNGEAFHKKSKTVSALEIRIDKNSCVNERGSIRIVFDDVFKNYVYNKDGLTDVDILGRFLCKTCLEHLSAVEGKTKNKSNEIRM